MPSLSDLLRTSGLDPLDARVLAAQVLGVSHAWLLAHGDEPVADDKVRAFRALVCRRQQGEPVAYLVGTREFWGLSFKVTPATLIPRPDTETLVAAALALLPNDRLCRVLDLGTGTGAIGIALAHERPLVRVVLVDAQSEALAVAAHNVRAILGSDARVQLVQSDWFTALSGQTFDLIVSNPPYIAENDPHLREGDVRFEPMTALTSGTDGLNALRAIIQTVPEHLKKGGCLLVEHGYDQAQAVANLFSKQGFTNVVQHRDLAGIIRVTGGFRRQETGDGGQ